MSTQRRAEIDDRFAKFIVRNNAWAANYFAGFMFEMTRTLPPEDPWRRLSATIDLALISVGQSEVDPETRVSFHNRNGAKPGTATGAYRPDGSPFGDVTDATDLSPSELGPPANDWKLTAVSERLDPLSAALVGFSMSTAEALASVLSRVYHHLWLAEFGGISDRNAGEAYLDVVGEAVRWVVHRRRAYTGLDDPFPAVAGFGWVVRADRVTTAGRNIAGELGIYRDAVIDAGTYDAMKADL